MKAVKKLGVWGSELLQMENGASGLLKNYVFSPDM